MPDHTHCPPPHMHTHLWQPGRVGLVALYQDGQRQQAGPT